MKHSLKAVWIAVAVGLFGGPAQAQEMRERRGSPRVAIVPIVGALDETHVALVRRAGERIRAERPDLAIFEIDTPGGRIDHMIQIGEEIMRLDPVPTAAYVRPPADGALMGGAISAGVYLAISCKRLYMFPGTVIGASAPVMPTAEGLKPVEEKGVSMAREKFRARAEQNGYPPNLVVAMVDQDLEIFEVDLDGRKAYLTDGEIEKLRSEGRKFDVPTVPFDSREKLLTLTDRQVEQAGMGKIAATRSLIYEDLRLVSPVEETIAPSWSENLVGFLTSGLVSVILLVVGILGIWVELKTPGFGAAGVIGILAIGLLLFGNHLAGLAEISEMLLIIAGVGLVVVELIVLPGTGVFAITGVICILAGFVLSFQDFTLPDTEGAPWQVDVLMSSVGRVLLGFVGASVGFLAVVRFLPKVPLLGRLVLQEQIVGTAPAPAATSELAGRQGHALTPLHPGGKIEIDGETHDVVAEGEFVARGEPVEVVRVEGLSIVVRKLKR
jgi:membrane-bound serine protease (ClpP class)